MGELEKVLWEMGEGRDQRTPIGPVVLAFPTSENQSHVLAKRKVSSLSHNWSTMVSADDRVYVLLNGSNNESKRATEDGVSESVVALPVTFDEHDEGLNSKCKGNRRQTPTRVDLVVVPFNGQRLMKSQQPCSARGNKLVEDLDTNAKDKLFQFKQLMKSCFETRHHTAPPQSPQWSSGGENGHQSVIPNTPNVTPKDPSLSKESFLQNRI